MRYEVEWPPRAIERVTKRVSTNTLIWELSLTTKPGSVSRELVLLVGCQRGHRTNIVLSSRFKAAHDRWVTWNAAAAAHAQAERAAFVDVRAMPAPPDEASVCAVCVAAFCEAIEDVYDYKRISLAIGGDGLRVLAAAGRTALMRTTQHTVRKRTIEFQWCFLRTCDAVLAHLLLDVKTGKLVVPYFHAISVMRGIWSSPEAFASGRALLSLAFDAADMTPTETARRFVEAYLALHPEPTAPKRERGSLADFVKRRRSP